MSAKRVPVSWWEVAEMVYERRNGWTWERIACVHGISTHKVKREINAFRRMYEERQAQSN